MSPDDFKIWRKAIDFSKDEAAEALGVSKATIEEYDAGNRFDDEEIPKAVALACTALYYRLSQWSG
jgi:transcriptional regulator with XRE-family HTH domain